MKRIVEIFFYSIFFLFLQNPSTLCAQDDFHSAPAYKVRNFETSEEPDDAPKLEDTQLLDFSALQCNPVEFGQSLPYPTTTVALGTKFYTVIGKADWLPDDPGDQGKNSIEGIDSDGDCVRDDIERLIARLLPHSGQKKARYYMFEYAKWRGRYLLPQQNRNSIAYYSEELYRAGECVRRAAGDDRSRDLFDLVFAKFHNTFERSDRYIENNAKLGGWNTREKIEVSCP